MNATIVLVLTIVASLAAGDASGDGPNPIPPIADIQARIERVMALDADQHAPAGELAAAMDKDLGELAIQQPEGLIRQTLHYHLKWEGKDERRCVGVMGILWHFRFQEHTLVSAVLPYLNTDHPGLRVEVNKLLRRAEGQGSYNDPPSYSSYETLIRANRDAPPRQLVAHMYARHPGKALLAMQQVYVQADRRRTRELLWAEHVVADVVWKHQNGFLEKTKVEPEAATQLEKLSQDQTWWVRLYVAEILRQHPAFRTPALVDRLKDDPHELVRNAMRFTRPDAEKKPAVKPGYFSPTKPAQVGPERKP